MSETILAHEADVNARQKIEELHGATVPVVQRAADVVILDQEGYEAAAKILTEIVKPLLKEIDDVCGPVCSATHRAHVAATNQREKLKAPLLEAKRIIDRKMSDYNLAQERHRRQVEAEERERLRREQEEALLAEAQRLEEAGQQDRADAILESPPPAPPAPVAAITPTPKAEGVAARKVYAARVTDLLALIRHVADGLASPRYLSAEVKEIERDARALDGKLDLPGVEITGGYSISSRRAR